MKAQSCGKTRWRYLAVLGFVGAALAGSDPFELQVAGFSGDRGLF
jgi:hypothetical protein